MNSKANELREQILTLVSHYFDAAFPQSPFVPGKSSIPVAGRVFDSSDLQSLVKAALDFWLTSGPFTLQFEKKIADFMGLKYASLVNSGSSANLLALTALTSPSLGDRRLTPGDEVITTAAGFPTTVNPIIQNGLIPVFVDVDIPTYNIKVSQLEKALSPHTRAIMLAHTLGNPFQADKVAEFAEKNGLWLIEDCCDALGSEYKGRLVGYFGHLTTLSFYPAHHITMGEGGCVLTNDAQLKRLVESFRDWGRDCWCQPGSDNTCGKRFGWAMGDLPFGYDHKYVYSHIGYNLKATDLQAAVGLSQLEKVSKFIAMRRNNFKRLHEGLKDLEEFFILPQATEGSNPSWFGFPLCVRPEAPFTRLQVIQYLEKHKMSTRLLFGGNLTRQPAYRHVKYRVAGELKNSDFVMNNLFWIGVYPGIDSTMLDYILDRFHAMPGELC